MKVWELKPDHTQFSEYYFSIAEEEQRFEAIFESHIFNGMPASKEWISPLLLKQVQRKDGAFASFKDLQIIVSQSGKDLLEPFLQEQTEWLEIENDETTFYYPNVRYHSNCLDIENCKFKRTEITGKIISITEMAFFPQELEGIKIFKVPGFGMGWQVFVTDEFKAFCESHHLEGLDLNEDELIWTNE